MKDDLDRRDFIKLASLGTASLAVSGSAESLLAKGAENSQAAAAGVKDGEIFLVGHAHIDGSWMWPRSETMHEVCPLTFESVLKMMAKHPKFIYAQSSAQYYTWTERYYPEIFEQIKKKVAAGQWEIVGGAWVEHNTNIPNGESLVRQHLYAKRYFQEKFGVDVKIGWLPDVFGFSWNMPQIYRKCGIDYFVTHKLKWQVERNNPPVPFPYHIFWWEASDGSRVLAFHTVGGYGQRVRPEEMLRELATLKKMHDVDKLMILYGKGDHGGGPMPEMVDRAIALMHDPNFPTVRFSKALEYFETLKTLPQHTSYPVMEDELYVKTHRGTFTTDSQVKRDNRECEVMLMNAEKFSLLATEFGHSYPEDSLKPMWEKLLFGQVHDNIDGSSIAEVYRDAATDYGDIKAGCRQLIDSALGTIASRAHTEGEGRSLLIFNPVPWPRTDLVSLEAGDYPASGHFTIHDTVGRSVPYQMVQEDGASKVLFIAENVPGLGFKQYRLAPAGSKLKFATDLTVSGLKLANDRLEVEVDPHTGNLRSLRKKGIQADFVAPGLDVNALEVWEDRPPKAPAGEPAWNIYLGADHKLDAAESVNVVESGPVRAIIRVKKHFGDSSFEQDTILYSRSDRVDFELRADWHEKYHFAKVAFPFRLKSDFATYEIPFGSIQRYDWTLTEDPNVRMKEPPRGWEIADRTKFEVAGQRWADVSDQSGSYGVSLLNDSKYGFCYQQNVFRMSLIRGPRRGYPGMPDTWSDQSNDPIVGIHHVKYALVPHRGTWQDDNATRRGVEFNAPFLARLEPSHGGEFRHAFSALNVEPGSVVVESLKKAEDSNDTIVRVYETCGKEAHAVLSFNRTPRSVRETDMMEWDKFVETRSFTIEGTKVHVPMAPHEIKTLLVKL
ncbi:MAG TPA: glycoside hydrolase family 38 C-terminal domain-containing protein [Terriglobia bacterium]|nr:glycoside hydrolase family 38 C-terminal domain-containing protein [Terriglobia bacterium]